MNSDTRRLQESTASESTDERPSIDSDPITGPHDGLDADGHLDHHYWRCERCGLESTDTRMQAGCFRCGAGQDDSNASRDERNADDADREDSTDGEDRSTTGGRDG